MTDVDQTCGHGSYIASMHRYETMRRSARPATDTPRRLFVGVLCLTVAASMVRASEVYKSVDANGNVVYSDHLDPSMAQPTVVQVADPRFPPRELHFCWTNCFTLALENGVYRRIDGTDESWTVETFSAQGVVLHRHDAPVDWNGYSQDVVYAGKVSNDRLVDVTVNGKRLSGIDASWGSALNTLPGTNAERDAKKTENLNSSGGTVSTAVTPPPLAQEEQPPLSQDGFLWTPGYWYWREQAYSWMPGAWVRPPQTGLLWTPAYWSSAGTVFVFHPGHWGSTVGFYGGVNYGYGYFGNGYSGGHWIGNSFAYNSTVNHVNTAVAHHTYAESGANQASRGGFSYLSEPRTGDAIQAASQHQSLPRAVNKPVPTTTVQRTGEKAPEPVEVKKPAAVVKTQATGAPAKSNHVTPSKAAPIR